MLADLLPGLAAPDYAPFRATLDHLACSPPQTMLWEGGNEEVRLQAGLYWAMLANCPASLAARREGHGISPCCQCPACRQMSANENLDLHVYDGRIANRQDEEKPEAIRALRMENIRDLKIVLGSAPRGNGRRVVIIQGMTATREEALNSLLKILEEPAPHTLFCLLTPQRQQILPTLVSRSFCMTLPWTDSGQTDATGRMAEAMGSFLQDGSGFLEQVAKKGALDASSAAMLILVCQKSLANIATGDRKRSSLDLAMAKIAREPQKFALVSRWLMEAQEMLAQTVSPGRVLEALATRLFLLGKE